MTSVLDTFIKTGRLGPIALGMRVDQIELLLGEPAVRSLKLRPFLLLKYGSLELSFWGEKDGPQALTHLTLLVDGKGIPSAPQLYDPLLTPETFIDDFAEYMARIDARPQSAFMRAGDGSFVMPSGVQAFFVNGRLNRLRVTQEDAERDAMRAAASEREPSAEDIHRTLEEARRLLQQNFTSAALLVVLGGLEAAIRRLARASGLHARYSSQIGPLIGELGATRALTPEQIAFLRNVRELRTTIAHGFVAPPVRPDTVLEAIALGEQMLAPAAAVRQGG